MPLEISNTPFEVDGSRFTMTSASPVILNGLVFRVFNSASTANNYTYTDTTNAPTTISVPSSGSSGNPTYVLIASGSVIGGEFSTTETESWASSSIVEGFVTYVLFVTSLIITGSIVGNNFTEVILTAVGSGSWTKPAGVTEVVVECLSGGGAGGGAAITNCAGGGGGGGQYCKSFIRYPSAQQSIPYVIGAGGIGSTGNGTSGSSTTWNSTEVVAVGGAGGLADQIGEVDPRGGGVSASLQNAVGQIIYGGGKGAGGYYDPFGIAGAIGSLGGSGGGGAGYIGTPYDLGNRFGDGAFASSGGANGESATVYAAFGGGGGGGAARVSSGPSRSGGSGGAGLIRLHYR